MKNRRPVNGIVLAVVLAMVFGLVLAGHSTWAETGARTQKSTVGVEALQVGRAIDLYGGAGNVSGQVSPYPVPYGGQGPNRPMDIVPANSTLILCANVTFDYSPVQGTEVRFVLFDLNGNVLFNDTRLSDQYGMANVTFPMPWPSQNPESLFGVWHATAAASISDYVIEDSTQFIYDWMVHIWNVGLDKASYQPGEWAQLSIYYGTYSQQFFQLYLIIDLVDASNVTVNENYAYWTIGGSIFGQAQNYSANLYFLVPNSTVNGTAHVYCQFSNEYPSNSGSLLCPVYSPAPAITIISSLPGDLNGDNTVDIYDAIILAGAYNSKPGDPNWNPNADINNDGIVDLYDAIQLAGHYNQHYP